MKKTYDTIRERLPWPPMGGEVEDYITHRCFLTDESGNRIASFSRRIGPREYWEYTGRRWISGHEQYSYQCMARVEAEVHA